MRRGRKSSGAVLIEFMFVGIGMIFVLISTFEMARGMWIYNSLSHAAREGTRFAIVHGKNCSTLPYACTVTIGNVTTVIQNASLGLDPAELNVTFESGGTGFGIWSNVDASGTMTAMLANTTVWPPAGRDAPGTPIQVQVSYPFRSAIAMFWTGVGPGQTFGVFNLPASSADVIQF